MVRLAGFGYPYKFEEVYAAIAERLANAPDVSVGEWQALLSDDSPMSMTIEIEDVSFAVRIPGTMEEWQEDVHPNLPWAEEHFQERVSGVPYNPPPSHVRWPFAQRSNAEHTDSQERFSHTYPERFWPKSLLLGGIRYPTGDLNDLVELLRKRPSTRQAYLPVWFPEDLHAATRVQARVPCTLGYHFLQRDGYLKVTYYIRSCDFYRHFRDDVYMAGRLCQWICDQINMTQDEAVLPGRLVMHISSMHVFSAERERIVDDADRLNRPSIDFSTI